MLCMHGKCIHMIVWCRSFHLICYKVGIHSSGANRNTVFLPKIRHLLLFVTHSSKCVPNLQNSAINLQYRSRSSSYTRACHSHVNCARHDDDCGTALQAGAYACKEHARVYACTASRARIYTIETSVLCQMRTEDRTRTLTAGSNYSLDWTTGMDYWTHE